MFKMVAFKLDFFFQMTQKMPENLVCSSWWRFFLLFVASRGGKMPLSAKPPEMMKLLFFLL